MTKLFTLKTIISREIIINEFISSIINENQIILNLGAGLDSRHIKYKNQYKKWIDIDLQDSINLKRKIYNSDDNYSLLASDIFELEWMKHVSKENCIILCEGTLMYYHKKDVIEFLNKLFTNFKNSFFIFEFIGKHGVKYKHPMIKSMGMDIAYLSSLSNENDLFSLDAELIDFKNVFDNDKINWFKINRILNIFGVKSQDLLSTIYLFKK